MTQCGSFCRSAGVACDEVVGPCPAKPHTPTPEEREEFLREEPIQFAFNTSREDV